MLRSCGRKFDMFRSDGGVAIQLRVRDELFELASFVCDFVLAR